MGMDGKTWKNMFAPANTWICMVCITKRMAVYQEGMRDLSVKRCKRTCSKIPVRKKATTMLDIGGSHGLFSIELCKKHPSVKYNIRIAGAIEAASAIAKRYDTTNRVTYVAGNALNDDLGKKNMIL
jgi:hypothetical protein